MDAAAWPTNNSINQVWQGWRMNTGNKRQATNSQSESAVRKRHWKVNNDLAMGSGSRRRADYANRTQCENALNRS